MNSFRAFLLAEIAPLPWRNGGGLTREIAVGRVDGQEPAETMPWDWRLSMASIDSEGPFSSFAGIDRSAVLMSGALELEGDGDRLLFGQTGDRHSFAGERVLHASPRAPATRLFNVMTRRGKAGARVQVHRCDCDIDPGQCGCLLVARGRFELECGAAFQRRIFDLDADGGLLWSRSPGPCRLVLRSPEGCLIRTSQISTSGVAS